MKERGGAGKSPNQELTNQRNNHPNEGGSNKESAANTRLSPLLTETLKKQFQRSTHRRTKKTRQSSVNSLIPLDLGHGTPLKAHQLMRMDTLIQTNPRWTFSFLALLLVLSRNWATFPSKSSKQQSKD